MGIKDKTKPNKEEQLQMDQLALGAADDLSQYQNDAPQKKFKDMHTLSNPKLDDGEKSVFEGIQDDLEGLSAQKTLRMLLRLGMLAYHRDAIHLNKPRGKNTLEQLGDLSSRETEFIQSR